MKPYPEYKNGPDWMGQVPAHWDVKKSKFVFREVSRKGFSDEPLLSVTQKHGVIRRDAMADFDMRGMHVSTDLLNFKLVKPDNFVISLRSFEGGIERSKVRGVVSPAYTVMEPRTKICEAYWHKVLKCHPYIEKLNSVVTGIRQGKNIAYTDFGEVSLAVPPLDEQEQIVRYLGAKQREIERYIAAKRALLARLNELSAAVISRAVTRGLNAEVALKPSGVQWLGDVPQHWDVKKLKFVCKVQTGSKNTEDALREEEGGYPFFVRSQKVERINSFTFDGEAVLTAGDGAGVGKVFHHYTGRFDAHQRVYVLNKFRRISGAFLFLYLKEFFYKVALAGTAKSTVESLRMPVFLNFTIPLPPLEEQKCIVDFIEAKLATIAEARGRIEREIELARELGQTLVANVVTGQFDVSAIEVADHSSQGDDVAALEVDDETELEDELLEIGDE